MIELPGENRSVRTGGSTAGREVIPMTSNPMVSAHVYRDLSGAEQTLPRRAAMTLAKLKGGKVYRQAKDGRLLFVAAFVR